jgi:hypothetical protein
MKRFNDSKISMVLFVFAGAIVLGGSAKADFTFGEPVNLGQVINSTFDDWGAWISSDALCLYFCRPPNASSIDAIWLTTRPTIHDPWETPINLGVMFNWFPCKSIENALGLTTADGLEQYGWGTDGFWRSVGYGGVDIWFITRGTLYDEWSTPQNLGAVVNSLADEASLAISPDGLELYFSGLRSSGMYVRPSGCGQSDLWVTKRSMRDEPWCQPVNLGEGVNSAYQELRPNISVDNLVLFFDSRRPGGKGQEDLYMTRRATISDPWQAPLNLGPIVNSPASDQDAHVSADGSTLFFNSNRPGGHGSLDLWQTPIIPIVDFNNDGNINTDDLLIMINNWGSSEMLCDVGPMPWGDGVVDIEDLKVFIKYWEQENLEDYQEGQ